MSKSIILRQASLTIAAMGVLALLTAISFFPRDTLAQTEPAVESVEVTRVTDSTADITVNVANTGASTPTVYLRYRTPRGSGTWLPDPPKQSPTDSTTSSAQFTLSASELSSNTDYEVQASLDSTFETGSRYAVFRTHGEPSDLRVTVAPGDRQLTVSWTVSLNGGSIDFQRVDWRLSTDSNFTPQNPGNDARSYVIPNLDNDTDYTVKVTVDTNYGAADVELTGLRPASGPSLSDMTFPTIGRTSATARVSVNNATSATTVKLRYRMKGATDWSATATRTVSGGVSSFPLSGLRGYTMYEVEASLETNFQTSLVRDLLTAKSTPGPPESVSITDSDMMLDLSWAPPTNDGGEPISGYVVQWKSNNQSYSATRRIQIASNVLPEAQITNLVNGTEYTVRVFATNRLGNGIAVEVKDTPGTVPGSPPTSVTAAACDTALHVSWSPPVDDGGSPITSYIIQWKSGTEAYDESASSTRQTIRPTADTSYTLEGLQANTEYTIRVAGVNIKVDTTDIATSGVQWSDQLSELSAMTQSGTCLTELRFGNPLASSVPAYVTVEDAVADTVIYLRYQPDGATSWVSTMTATPGSGSSTVTFDITDLTPSTRYEVETSLDSGFSVDGSTIRGFFTTGATADPIRPGDGSSSRISRIEPGISSITMEPGDEALLWVDVYGRQDVLDNALADRDPSAGRPSFSWSTSGQGSFEEADIKSEWRNSQPDDREVIFVAPDRPGTLTIEASLPSENDCQGQQSEETVEEATARCSATLTVRVKRSSVDLVVPTPTGDGSPDGLTPPLEPRNPTPFDVTKPEDGGTIFSNGGYVEIDKGTVVRGQFIWIQITPIGPASNEGKTWQRFTLHGTEYEVTVVDSSGVTLSDYTFRKPVIICIPLPDELRRDLSDVALIAIDDERELTYLASVVRTDEEAVRVCGARSEFPINVAVGHESAPPPAGEPPIEEELPDTGGIAPNQVIIVVSMMLGFAVVLVGLTVWRRRLRGGV